MYTKKNCIAIFIMAILTEAAIVIGQDFINHDSEFNLLSFMSRSNSLMQRDPLRSADCFQYYIPKINECVAEYEKNFKDCGNRANSNRSEVDDASLSSRMAFRNRTSNSCHLITICEDDESARGEMECYANQGTNTAKLNQGISSDATSELNDLNEQHRVIDHREMKCTNDTKSAYEKQSAQYYADFNGCLLGDPLPTTSTTPEISTTDETTSYWDTTTQQSS